MTSAQQDAAVAIIIEALLAGAKRDGFALPEGWARERACNIATMLQEVDGLVQLGEAMRARALSITVQPVVVRDHLAVEEGIGGRMLVGDRVTFVARLVQGMPPTQSVTRQGSTLSAAVEAALVASREWVS